jgi:hypothetical protein
LELDRLRDVSQADLPVISGWVTGFGSGSGFPGQIVEARHRWTWVRLQIYSWCSWHGANTCSIICATL